MFTAECLLCGAENSGNVCGSCASLLDTEGFDFAPRAEQTSKLFVRIPFGLLNNGVRYSTLTQSFVYMMFSYVSSAY